MKDEAEAFQLELFEDFAIVDSNGRPREIVQVKDYSKDLGLSVLRDFFKRSSTQLKADPNAVIKVVSFGSVGRQLSKAWREDDKEREQIRKKLVEPKDEKAAKLTRAEVDSVFAAFEIVEVEESVLEEKVFDFLRETLAGGAPEHAFELLQFWLLRLSEKSALVTYNELLNRLTNVGKYLGEREAYYQEWFTSIKPLQDISISEHELTGMRQAFYQGIDAKYRHILGDVDAIRETKLSIVNQKFDSSNVVIIHGASGQGKSTLAYRYLRDYVPTSSRFEIVAVENIQHALEIARALSGHFQAIGIEMYIYIDAQPGNDNWTYIIQQLGEYQNIKFLVTIREEDFRRVDTPATALGLPETFELTFDKAEGEEIYKSLLGHKTPEHVLTFEEAWQRFGATGPLLEFVYLITQNESLRGRLEKQVNRLKDEVRLGVTGTSELNFLRTVSAASAYGTRLDLLKLVRQLGLPAPEATVSRYEREYLLRTSVDGRYVEGLHPLRSMILTELLTDPILQPWHDNIQPILETAVTEDLEAFLLFAFSRRSEARQQVVEALLKLQPSSWLAASAILKALLWLGVREQIEKDQDVIGQAFERFHSAWWMTLNCDLTKISREVPPSWVDGLAGTGLISDEAIKEAHTLRDQQASLEETFNVAKDWLSKLEANIENPDTVFEWLGFANVVYWLGHFQQGDAFALITEERLNAACKTLPLEVLSEVTQALSIHTAFQEWFPQIRQVLLERFQKETDAFFLEDDGRTIRAHFIVDLESRIPNIDDIQHADDLLNMPAQEVTFEEQDADYENQIHGGTMQRVSLLRKLIPDRLEYGSRGYGHRWSSLDVPYDETEKNISKDYLLPKIATKINGFYSKLGTYPYRPETWKNFANPEITLRRSVVKVVLMLQKALEGHFKKKTLVDINSYVNFDIWNACLSALKREALMPKLAVDEWGFISDADTRTVKKKDGAEHSAIEKLNVPLALTELRPFLENRKKLIQGIQNFLPQSLHVFKINTFRARRTDLPSEERERIISESPLQSNLDSRSQLNLNDAYIALPRYQTEFKKNFGHFFEEHELKALEKQESEAYSNLWSLWHELVEHSNRRLQNPARELASRADKVIPQVKRQIENDFKKLAKESVNARLLPIDLLWDKQQVLWITVDSEPHRIHEDIPKVLETLQNSVGTLEYGSLKQVLLEQHFEQICVLPLVDGKLIAKAARRISSSSLFGANGFEGRDWWNQAFYPLTENMLRAIGLEIWDDSRLEIVRRLASLIGNLYILVAHISDLNRFDVDVPDESNQKATEIIQPYLEHRMTLINNVLQAAIDTEAELLTVYEKTKEIDTLLAESFSVLKVLHTNILPQPQIEGEEMAVQLSEMPEWLKRLEEAVRQSEVILLVWLEHVRQGRG